MKTFLTIAIVILILRILVRYQNGKVQDRIRSEERVRYEYMQEQQRQRQAPRQEPKITVTRQSKNDGDYIDYEEVN
ncbi:hypothetical protein BH09BAC1_BH09BAC1_24110 [soil metagenome]